jgi:hypothetical protein
LHAALAVWKFCFDSAKYIFGDRSTVKLDGRLQQILQGANNGLTRTEISAALNHHYAAEAIGSALERLREKGIAVPQKQSTRGRAAQCWSVVSKEDA